MKLDLRQLGFFVGGCLLALVPVVGANVLIASYVQQSSTQLLHDEAERASKGAEAMLGELVNSLRAVATASGATCSDLDVQRFRDLTMSEPAISFAAKKDADGNVTCSFPELGSTPLIPFGERQPIFDGNAFLSQVRLEDSRSTGIKLLTYSDDQSQIHAIYIPRRMLSHLFDEAQPGTGIVLTVADTVLYARDPAPAPEGLDAQIEVASLPIAGGNMRVQVSVDRSVMLQSFQSVRDLATFGAIIIGALFVLLVTRLIRYTPSNVNEMERAIANGEFVPYYQPVIDIESGKLVGCEVLVRWIKPDGTMVPPGSFIGLAEQTGLAVPMTRKLMETVVEDLQGAYAGRPGLKVAINLFNQHFENLDVIEDVERVFGPSSILYSQVVLEITERAPLQSISQAKVIMRKLQRLGCRLALDDAGTGHGGLAYLQELGLDIVKIDKMFIDQLGKGRIGEAITHMLTDLAQQLDMEVVAEGIEDIEQVKHLKRFGIRQAQGYLFAPALQLERYLALVEKLGVANTRRAASDPQLEAERKAATIRAAAQELLEAQKQRAEQADAA